MGEPPLEVKHQNIEDVDKNEMALVYSELAPFYCICNHHKLKHNGEGGKCTHRATRITTERGVEEFVCECPTFTSHQHRAEETPTR